MRLAVGEQLVDGLIHQVFACGHTKRAVLDRDGLWVHENTSCSQCLNEMRDGVRKNTGLTDEEILRAIDMGDWDLSAEERLRWLARARQVWHYVRYGDEGVRFEQGVEGG